MGNIDFFKQFLKIESVDIFNYYTCYYLQNAYKGGSGRDKRKTPFVGQNR